MKNGKVTCSVGFLLLAAGLIYLDGISLAAQCFLACALHEAGHCVAANLFGSRVCSLRITAAGAEMVLDPAVSLSYLQDALIAFAGPGINLLAACAAIYAGWYLFAGFNICFAFFNLLPILPLDGGRILSDVLSICWPFAADRIVYGFSIVISGALLGLGWAAWREWGNFSLLCTAAWITGGTLKQNFR